MSTSSPAIGRHEMETLIIERAWKDPDFKKEFTTDPKGTIEKYSGQKLPSDIHILVHEEDAHTMHLTLPAPPPNLAELSDEELERVAGGTDVAITAAIITAISALVSAGVSVANDQTRARAGW
jgi:hypothetical protein